MVVTTFVIAMNLLPLLLIATPFSGPFEKGVERLARAGGFSHVFLPAVPVPLVDFVRLQVELKRKLVNHVSIPVNSLRIARLQHAFLLSSESLTLVCGVAAF